jgi:hypothetical protein
MDTKDNAILQELNALSYFINETEEELKNTSFIRVLKKKKLKAKLKDLTDRAEKLALTSPKED